MMSIPPEILSIIAYYLPTSSIPNYRLTNKTWAVIGMPFLIPSVSIKLLPNSLTRFTQISEHPVFRQYVTEVVLIKDVADNCGTLEEWCYSKHRSRPWPPAPKDDTEESQAAYALALERTWGADNAYQFPAAMADIGWHCQQEVRSEQQTLMAPGLPELSQCLASAFPRLPHLKTIRLAGCRDGVDSLGYQRLALEHQQRYKYSESLSIEGLLVGVSQLRNALICASKSAMPQIEHLSAYELHVDFFHPESDDFQSLCLGASSLQSLDIDFNLNSNRVYGNWFGRNFVEYDLSIEKGGIKSFLAALPNLRSLRLCFGTIGALRQCPKFEHVLNGVQLPNLEDLDIAGFQTKSQEFLQFFSDHASSLKRIKLKDICMTNGERSFSWIDVLIAIKQEIKLQDIALSGKLETLSPSSLMDMSRTIPLHSRITVDELLTGFMLDRNRAEIFGTLTGTKFEGSDIQKLEVMDLKEIMRLIETFG